MWNNQKVEIVDFEKEQRRRERKQALSNTWNGFANFVRSNMDVLIIAVPATVAVVGGVTKVASKAISAYTLNREINFKERTIYDHSLGRYVELKRPLSAAQSLTIEERRANGEKLHMILADMNLLKS